MSISMERFAFKGHFATHDPNPKSCASRAVFGLECHCCGYEPPDPVVAPTICPKCQSTSWERFVIPGSILKNARRYVA
ncbi:MAG: hypothetical protein ABR964_07845 [Tepidisphaeraceae bacterium]|jgi:hypothetical protein